MTRVWRICAGKFRRRAFDGSGARLHGGRWNPPGVSLVYTAGALSLAALEIFVNLEPEDLPPGFIAIPATIPREVPIREIAIAELPWNWRAYPAPAALQKLGADWVAKNKGAVLSVPSAIVSEERNYLLNPAHPDFRRIKIGGPQPFRFDPRMWKRTVPSHTAAR